MTSHTYINGILLLCFCQSLAENLREEPILIYSYDGEMINYNSYSDEAYARWLLSGNVKMQATDKFANFKLNDLKTSLYNGLRSGANSAQIKPIPETAGILMDPFVVANDGNNNLEIKVQQDEPYWSVNLKRAIGSTFFFDSESVINKKPQVDERIMFGQCKVKYEYDNENGKLVVHKIIDEKNCKEFERLHNMFNLEVNELNKDFDQIVIDTVNSYTIEDKDGEKIVTKIEALSNITYKTMPDDKFLHQIEQRQILKLLNTLLEKEETIDVSKNTQTKDIIYDYGPSAKYDFRWYPINSRSFNKTQEELAESYLKQYDVLDNYFQIQTNLTNYKWSEPNSIDDMTKYLLNMNYDGLTILKNKILERNNTNMENIFLDILPYIGTNTSTKFVKELIKNQTFDLVLHQAVTMLSILPTHLKSPTEDILKELEDFTNFQFDKELLPGLMLPSPAILPFASLVEKSKSKNLLSQEQFDKYRDSYHEKYQTGEDYEGRMIYLLGLINMGEHLNKDFMYGVLTNLTESNYLRSLAIYGFKKYVICEPEKLFKTFWPIVQNKSESFDVRVASLDLLLSTKLSENHLNEIAEIYERPQSDPDEQHLSNYFLTTLVSIRDVTKYFDPLGSLATETLKKRDFPSYLQAWGTGNYRFSYTDSKPNLGQLFQTRLVAEPSSNMINLVQINYNSFALNRNLGSYSVYLKLDGVVNEFMISRLNSRMNDNPIDVLVELLKTNNFKLKENQKIHVDFALFKNEKAIFAIHTDDVFTYKKLFQYLMGVMEYMLSNSFHVDFPIMDYTALPTAFGTDLWILLDDENIARHDMDQQLNFSGRAQSNTVTWFENHITYLDAAITSFKRMSSESVTNIILWKYNAENSYFAFENNNSTNYTSVIDHIAGTMVSGKSLKEFCPKCEEIYEIPLDFVDTDNKGILKKFTGIEFNIVKQYRSNDEINTIDEVSQLLNLHEANYFFSPIARSVLLYRHYSDYNKYFLGKLTRSRTATNPNIFFKIVIQVLSSANYFNRGPYADNYMNISISFLNRDETRSVTKNFANLTYKFLRKSDPEIKYNQVMQLVFGEATNRTSVCLDRQIIFPNIPVDPLNLSPPDTASGKMELTYDRNLQENDSACKSEFTVISESLSIPAEKSDKITKSKEYKVCKEQSLKHKFIPPTPECIVVHNKLSKYSNYEVRGNFEKLSQGAYKDITLAQIIRVNDYTLHLVHSQEILKSLLFHTPDYMKNYLNYNITAGYFDRLVGDPTSIAYNNNDMAYGLTSACVITPDTVSKFSGKILNNYVAKNNNNVALVECMGAPQYGLTFKKVNNKFIEFTIQANYNTILVTNDGNKIKMFLNEKRINKNYDNSVQNIMINYLSEDVVYISTKMFNIYYNTEYMFIESWSFYQNIICGLCSDD